jgi:hypothetical protein
MKASKFSDAQKAFIINRHFPDRRPIRPRSTATLSHWCPHHLCRCQTAVPRVVGYMSGAFVGERARRLDRVTAGR